MANNIALARLIGALQYLKTTASGTNTPIHTPHVNIDTMGGGYQATYTDKSGTITTGGTSQPLAAANASRKGLTIQNVSTGDLWFTSMGVAAVINQPSFKLSPGALYEYPAHGVPTTAITIIGATTGQSFSAREW